MKMTTQTGHQEQLNEVTSPEASAYRAIITPESSSSTTPREHLASAAAIAVGMAEIEAKRAGSHEPVAVVRYIGGKQKSTLVYRRGPADGVVQVDHTYLTGKKDAEGKNETNTASFMLSESGDALAVDAELPGHVLAELGTVAADAVIGEIRSNGRPTSRPVGPVARTALRAAEYAGFEVTAKV